MDTHCSKTIVCHKLVVVSISMTYSISPDIKDGSSSQKEHGYVTCSLLKYLSIASAYK